jgi:metal-responsive CopG/Arc/MetJ family transcriptional regulator
MKTAISIPDTVYETAEKLADRLGKSRSQLYTQAISSYIARHQQDAVTQQLNKIYADNSEPMDKILLKLQRQSLPKEEW